MEMLVAKSGRLLKKSLSGGCSKMSGCKASEILSREAYLTVRRMAKDEENAAAGRCLIDGGTVSFV
jgi:hypothetical protein